MTRIVEIDPTEITITPVFKHIQIENVPKSETAGHAVMEMKEVVEVRFAGSKNYSPVFPADAFWKREGNTVWTYAERWPEQFRAFKEGNPQEANGTPLEMLRPHGVTPEQLSLCRALRIYSIESLHHMEGPAVKSLGMHANVLKQAARSFLADRDKGMHAIDEVAALRAELEALRAQMVLKPEPSPEEVDAAMAAADDSYANLTDDDIKMQIADLTGSRPKGNPSRATLISALDELKAA